jgi:hypothetical protein
MKKLLFGLLMISSLSVVAQTEDAPSKRPFVYGGVGYTPTNDLTYSVEAGCWGITSPTSFSVTFDGVRTTMQSSKLDYWIGIKTYFTTYSDSSVSYMFYIAPKVSTGSGDLLIEYGLNPNYTLGKNTLLALTIGNQVTKKSPTNIFVSLGIIQMF